MMEFMRYPSPTLGNHHTDERMDIMTMSSRLLNTSLISIQEDINNIQTHEGGFQNEKPRKQRAFTTLNYQIPLSPGSVLNSPLPSPLDSNRDSYFHPKPTTQHLSPTQSSNQTALRPSLPSPQRSYSLIDYEPIPWTHQPGVVLTLPNLPPELHYAVFDFLDPIDSVCLALTSKHFYMIHRRMHGTVSLSSRRAGPNDMEWVWRHAGPFLSNQHGAGKQNSLALLSPRGQVYCRKCRTERCELHKHIKEWMARAGDVEYCVMTQKFGPPAREGASLYCYRSSPRHPHRCGRHTKNQRAVRLT
ncbi:hypothetical protein GGR57DRAFT_478049 [Xylariaceae sp. FL1272]|nr:hypothetical protein GGR57DRAFT_478049 [Xylariaceae sp. FL1272]